MCVLVVFGAGSLGRGGSDASHSRLLTGGTPFHEIGGKYVVFGATMGVPAPRGSMGFLIFCFTCKLKRVFTILSFLSCLGKVVENVLCSPWANIEFHRGGVAKNEVSGSPNLPRKDDFWVS